MRKQKTLEGMPTTVEHAIARLKGSELQFLSGELQRGFERTGVDREPFGFLGDPQWLFDLGVRCEAAAAILIAEIRRLHAQEQAIRALREKCQRVVDERFSAAFDDLKGGEPFNDNIAKMFRRIVAELDALLTASPAIGGWQPIDTLADYDTPVLMWTPIERLYEEPHTPTMRPEIRVASRRNWTWSTHWMPLPAPPASPSKKDTA